MKIKLKSLLLVLLFIASITTNANTNSKIDRIASELMQNTDFNELLRSTYALKLQSAVNDYSVKDNKHKFENSNDYAYITDLQKASAANVLNIFPEIKNLTTFERELLSAKVSGLFNSKTCVKDALISLGSCLGIPTLATIAYSICLSGSAAVTAFQVLAFPETIPVATEELEGEAVACGWLVGAKLSTSAVVSCVGTLINTVIGCK